MKEKQNYANNQAKKSQKVNSEQTAQSERGAGERKN